MKIKRRVQWILGIMNGFFEEYVCLFPNKKRMVIVTEWKRDQRNKISCGKVF